MQLLTKGQELFMIQKVRAALEELGIDVTPQTIEHELQRVEQMRSMSQSLNGGVPPPPSLVERIRAASPHLSVLRSPEPLRGLRTAEVAARTNETVPPPPSLIDRISDVRRKDGAR